MEEKNMSGKKMAYIVMGLIIATAVFIVLVIQFFYMTYDPAKYGRKNGGIDQGGKGEESAPLTNDLYEAIIISNSR
ncbi:hypothetical protein [Solibacillus sp. CAU 1738]|uniref:hypothetical protein n=1 Tax=Solibacillus sp. CAU 1738 TaxID=3140363 RepID=UPI003260F412